MSEQKAEQLIEELELPPRFLDAWRHFAALEHFPIFQEGVEFRCGLTDARRRNLALQQVSRELLDRREVSLPHIVHVGVTTLCNLQCPACPTGTQALGRPGEHLKFETYASMVEEIGDQLMFMLFWDWGEPLMHPRIYDMVRLAKQHDITTIISTNGTVACSEPKIRKLVESGLDYIIVCVDGATQESFEKYRVGGSLDRVLETTQRLGDIRASVGLGHPVIEFRSLATRYNEHELPRLLTLAQQTGADVFSVKSLRPYDYRGHDVDAELAPLTDRFARYKYGDEDGRHARDRIYDKGPLRCGKPMFAPTLNSDGQLAFCSYAAAKEEFFGRFPDHGLVDLWGSREAREKRINFQQRQGTQSCRRCYFRSDHKPTVLYTVQLNELPDNIRLQSPMTPEQFLSEYEKVMSHP